jgi:hypothetical protein
MNTKPKKYTKALLVKLDEETRARLDFVRGVHGTPLNEIVRQALAAYLDKV